MVGINITSAVISTRIANKLDLDRIASISTDAKYDKEKFPALVFRAKGPKATVLLFDDGKVVCTDIKNMNEVSNVMEEIYRVAENSGGRVIKNQEITVHSVIASTDGGLDLGTIAVGAGPGKAVYDPEHFPGLIYNLAEPAVDVNIFDSGKLMIIGPIKLGDFRSSMDKITSELSKLGLWKAGVSGREETKTPFKLIQSIGFGLMKKALSLIGL